MGRPPSSNNNPHPETTAEKNEKNSGSGSTYVKDRPFYALTSHTDELVGGVLGEACGADRLVVEVQILFQLEQGEVILGGVRVVFGVPWILFYLIYRNCYSFPCLINDAR